MQIAFVFGRTPELSREEVELVATTLPFLWSSFSVQVNILLLKPLDNWAEWSMVKDGLESEKSQLLLRIISDLQKRLGGTVKIVYLDKQVKTSDLAREAEKFVLSLQKEVVGKRTVGISIYGGQLNPLRFAMTLKRSLKQAGNYRLVIPEQGELSSAQIFHNHLPLSDGGAAALELNLIADTGATWLGVTLTSQDIDDYSRRDFAIPKPDPVSGMLPPKLAQMMINLGEQAKEWAVYDPFCGNGRIVMEAALMGIPVFGSDVVPKKVESAQENLTWLLGEERHVVWQADATSPDTPARFRAAYPGPSDFVIVAEPYLGKPLRAQLEPSQKEAWLEEIVPLYTAFLENWSASTLKSELRPQQMLLVFPRARVSDGTDVAVFESVVDIADRLGYHSERRFTYDRPDSFVRRDLIFIKYRLDK